MSISYNINHILFIHQDSTTNVALIFSTTSNVVEGVTAVIELRPQTTDGPIEITDVDVKVCAEGKYQPIVTSRFSPSWYHLYKFM